MDHVADSYRRFLGGDDNALEEIIRANKDGLMIYLNTFMHDVSVAEELTEDTFVKLVLKKPKFRDQSSFKTWLYSIARNLARDYLRRRKKQEVSLDDCPEISAEEADLEQAYIRQEKKILLHRTMRKLKPEYQQVLWLAYFENLSQKDVAKIMKKSVHNVETLAYRARRALKSKLLEEGFVYEEFCGNGTGSFAPGAEGAVETGSRA